MDRLLTVSQGVILEKMLTTEKAEFANFLNANLPSPVSEAEKNQREAYRYQKVPSAHPVVISLH